MPPTVQMICKMYIQAWRVVLRKGKRAAKGVHLPLLSLARPLE